LYVAPGSGDASGGIRVKKLSLGGGVIEEVFRDLDRYDLGDSVLDVGTGFGVLLEYLVRRGVGRIVTVDVDPSALGAAKRRFRDLVEVGVLRAVFGRAEELPFGNGEFHSVVSLMALHHFSDVEAALREAQRVARRLVLFYDWTEAAAMRYNPHSPEELRARREEALRAAERLGYRWEMHELWYKLEKRKTA